MSHPLTLRFAGRVLEIATEAKISKAYDATRMPGIPHPPYEPCKAVWDTGAMSTRYGHHHSMRLCHYQ